mmetsp:Transcript_54850/g.63076  ORF Transcript_54850/g.63076 Transcript_54850/m.63076 type:complete len:223 (+) Transcript_54850:303-971(+)
MCVNPFALSKSRMISIRPEISCVSTTTCFTRDHVASDRLCSTSSSAPSMSIFSKSMEAVEAREGEGEASSPPYSTSSNVLVEHDTFFLGIFCPALHATCKSTTGVKTAKTPIRTIRGTAVAWSTDESTRKNGVSIAGRLLESRPSCSTAPAHVSQSLHRTLLAQSNASLADAQPHDRFALNSNSRGCPVTLPSGTIETRTRSSANAVFRRMTSTRSGMGSTQ